MEIATLYRPQRKDGLEIHEIGNQFVVYDAGSDTIHTLNATAALVLEFCDGAHLPDEIAAAMQEAFGLQSSPLGEVGGCLVNLQQTGLIG